MNGAETQEVTYTYDVFNNLIGRSVSAPGQTTTNQSFVYDDPAANGQMVLAFGSTGSSPTTAQLTDRFLWGPAVDQILADNRVISRRFGRCDRLGAGRQRGDGPRLDDSGGAVAEHITYNAFGQQTGVTSNGSFNPDVVFGYTSKFYDTETELQWNVNRWYNSATGTWMSQDPLGFAGGQPNLNEYVGNNPANAVDPTGARSSTCRQCPPGRPALSWG